MGGSVCREYRSYQAAGRAWGERQRPVGGRRVAVPRRDQVESFQVRRRAFETWRRRELSGCEWDDGAPLHAEKGERQEIFRDDDRTWRSRRYQEQRWPHGGGAYAQEKRS